MNSVEDLIAILQQSAIGDKVELEVIRNGVRKQIQVTLGTRPF